MMLYYPEKCLRGRADCEPVAQLSSDGDDRPTFFCVGRNDGASRSVPTDCYRHCHRTNDGVDRMEDCDRRDLTDELSVIAQALSMLANEDVDDT